MVWVRRVRLVPREPRLHRHRYVRSLGDQLVRGPQREARLGRRQRDDESRRRACVREGRAESRGEGTAEAEDAPMMMKQPEACRALCSLTLFRRNPMRTRNHMITIGCLLALTLGTG